ncbi:MAG: tail fiber domain-containing protein, partial [Candidatus Pacebacteria bacterium]|nr:tail fiber domain-containing protein [Candidatus Paceibacterota bacterium]
KKLTHLLKQNWLKVFSVTFLLLFFGSYANIFAIASPYTPGETLDPTCLPGEVNCTVELGGGSVWQESGSDIYFDTGKVGIGTDTPTSVLDILLTPTTVFQQEFYEDDGMGDSLNDATLSGTFSGSIPGGLAVFIDSEGTPDTFGYMDMNGECIPSFGIPITGEVQELCLGISVIFENTSGHTIDDSWVYLLNQGVENPISINDIENNSYLNFNTFNNNLFMGYKAGPGAGSGVAVSGSVFLNSLAGHNADNAFASYFIGYAAGQEATDASKSVFIGQESGGFATNAWDSNFLGYRSGYMASGAYASNFLGYYAGHEAISADSSNFLGTQSGQQATNARHSNFFGNFSGRQAVNATYSNFFGRESGHQATNAAYSNFFGIYSGAYATSANRSNFFGPESGYQATEASHSNFFGYQSGYQSSNASNSIFIGQRSGYQDVVNNTGNTNDFSILIGKSTSTGGFSNSIALGGSATNTATNQFMIGSATRPINTTIWVGATGTTTLDTSTGLISTSDERLKTNIEDLPSDTLDKLLNIKTVTFNWLNGNNDQTNIGFIAQDLEQYFPELVYTGNDENNYKGVNYANMTPVLVEAIRELDLKVEGLSSLDTEVESSLGSLIKNFLADIGNGLEVVFFGEVRAKRLCLDGLCIERSDLENILNKKDTSYEVVPSQTDDEDDEEDEEDEGEGSGVEVVVEGDSIDDQLADDLIDGDEDKTANESIENQEVDGENVKTDEDNPTNNDTTDRETEVEDKPEEVNNNQIEE